MTGDSSSSGRADPKATRASPPIKNSAMTELFTKLFVAEERYKPALQLVKEGSSYMAVDCLSLDSDPLAWRKNEPTYH